MFSSLMSKDSFEIQKTLFHELATTKDLFQIILDIMKSTRFASELYTECENLFVEEYDK